MSDKNAAPLDGAPYRLFERLALGQRARLLFFREEKEQADELVAANKIKDAAKKASKMEKATEAATNAKTDAEAAKTKADAARSPPTP